MSTNFKKMSLGLKIIFLFLILSPLPNLIGVVHTTVMLSVEDTKKLELIQLEQWKKANLHSVEEYNRFWRNSQSIYIQRWPWVLGQLILALLMLTLRRWVWLALIVYFALSLLFRVVRPAITLGNILGMLFSIWCLYYLISRRAKIPKFDSRGTTPNSK